MRHRLAHRVGRSSQATPAAVDKPQSASHTEFLTTPEGLSLRLKAAAPEALSRAIIGRVSV